MQIFKKIDRKKTKLFSIENLINCFCATLYNIGWYGIPLPKNFAAFGGQGGVIKPAVGGGGVSQHIPMREPMYDVRISCYVDLEVEGGTYQKARNRFSLHFHATLL